MSAEFWSERKQAQFNKAKAQGKPYSADGEAGFIYRGKRFATYRRGARITGANYVPSCGCAVPPWLACDCSIQSIADRYNDEANTRLALSLGE